jgi:hypothetical protein
MTGDSNGVVASASSAEELVVVHVTDAINPTLAGREGGGSYHSPPQTLELAHTLVRLLLGWPTEPLDGQTRWRHPVAGGTQTVTLLATDGHLSSRGDAHRPLTADRPRVS